METSTRRKFLKSTFTLSALPLINLAETTTNPFSNQRSLNRFKISLNAYSFNEALRSGKTNLETMMQFCSVQGFDAVDLTGYYFPAYPEIPTDEYIYKIKRKAHHLGLAISGTGIRNEFAQTDKTARDRELVFVKQWIEVAAKLGAPVIRVFTKKSVPENLAWRAVAEQIIEDLKICVEHGRKHGVIVAVQNHNDFIQTADQAMEFTNKVNSEWFGIVLDTGSFITNEPYGEIAKASPHAVNWQIKEKLNYKGKSENMDLNRLFRIINASPYRGYLPIETLSAGDPFVIIPPFLKQVRGAMEKVING